MPPNHKRRIKTIFNHFRNRHARSRVTVLDGEVYEEMQDKIICSMPKGAANPSERSAYADFLVRSLGMCTIQERVKKSITKEIREIDCSKPAPSLYRRLSWKVIMALDEQVELHQNARAREPVHSADERVPKRGMISQESRASFYVECSCNNKKDQKFFDPIACFVRAAQEQFGTDNVAMLIRGDIFALSFSKWSRFPWDIVVSLESSILVNSKVLSSRARATLLWRGFAQGRQFSRSRRGEEPLKIVTL
jgi:hypothetical protein